MKQFKEISKNIAALSESLFDIEGDDRLKNQITKDSIADFLSKCKGKFDVVNFKDGTVRVNGKLIISGLTSDKIYFNCRDFHGKLIIENCPKLETLEGSFLEKMAVFDGSITINQCPSLTSIKGLPGLIKGDLSITNCKKLKSIEGIDMVYGNLYWSGNGKKYTTDGLKSETHVLKKIFCSEDEVEANVFEGLVVESFNNQWLQRLAAQLKKYPYKEYSWDDNAPDKYNKVDSLFNRFGRQTGLSGSGRLLDKITNDDIDVYDMSNDKEKKELGKVFYDTYSNENPNSGDLFLVYDEEVGEFIGGFGELTKRSGSGWTISWIHIPNSKTLGNNKIDRRGFFSKSEAREKLLNYGVGYTVVVINSGESTGSGHKERYQIRSERVALKSGVINPGDVEQYKKIAAANIKRYKDLIAQMKLERKKTDETAGYDKLIDEYEKIQLRIIKLVRAVAKDPKSFSKYDIDSFLEWCRDERRRNPNYKYGSKSMSEYYGSNGLMYYFKNFMSNYMTCFGGGGWKSVPDENDYKYLEGATKLLKESIDLADKKLQKFGF